MTKHDQPTPARTSEAPREAYVQTHDAPPGDAERIRLSRGESQGVPYLFIREEVDDDDDGWAENGCVMLPLDRASDFAAAVLSLTQSASLPQQGQGESGTVTVTREYRDAMLKERDQYREMCVLMRGYFESLRDVLATGYDQRAFSKVQMRAHLYAMNLVELLDGVTPEEAFKWWNTPWNNHGGAAPVPPQAHAVAAPVPATRDKAGRLSADELRALVLAFGHQHESKDAEGIPQSAWDRLYMLGYIANTRDYTDEYVMHVTPEGRAAMLATLTPTPEARDAQG